MNGLDLFSGIGGLTKALENYVKPVAYCEIDPYARAVLLSRMGDGSLPVAPVWDDVTTLRGENLPDITIIYGGFPCQDISKAGGNGKGVEGSRSGLFKEIVRLAKETKAEWLFLENVPNIRTKGIGRVLKELELGGYDCIWNVLSAASMGAPIRRSRWWLLAHSRSGDGCPKSWEQQKEWPKINNRSGWWKTEPNVDRVDNGLPFRLERNRALGNAVVPQQAKEAFERLMGFK